MVSATGIASFLLLAAGLAVAFLQMNQKAHEAEVSNRVQTPMMGGMRAAPVPQQFPVCEGIKGKLCCDLILEQYSNLKCDIVPEGSMVTMDYFANRVRVFVDADDVVTSIPQRG